MTNRQIAIPVIYTLCHYLSKLCATSAQAQVICFFLDPNVHWTFKKLWENPRNWKYFFLNRFCCWNILHSLYKFLRFSFYFNSCWPSKIGLGKVWNITNHLSLTLKQKLFVLTRWLFVFIAMNYINYGSGWTLVYHTI